MLYQQIWDEIDTVSIAIDRPNKYVTIDLLKRDSSLVFADILATNARETTRDLINLTYQKAIDSLDVRMSQNNEDLSWFTFKNTTVRHLLRLDPFSVDQVRVGGYASIVNAASKGHGPSWRMVVEMDPAGTKAWGVYPGSQTGNPGSPLYGHMISRWASGEYYPLLFGPEIKIPIR